MSAGLDEFAKIPDPATDYQREALRVLLAKLGIVTRKDRRATLSELVGRPVNAESDLTKTEAAKMISEVVVDFQHQGARSHGLVAVIEPRLFKLVRDQDVSGISGTGLVAWGVQFPDGRVATRWNGVIAQTCAWDSIEHVERIHGHGGATRLVWLDGAA